jgi:carbon storage regulator
MLVITCRRNERVFINGDEIKVVIVDVNGGSIRLGIDAPRNVSIHRESVWQRLQAEKECAS